jgi:hypothetical protein
MKIDNLKKSLLLFAISTVLVACGGGGDSGNTGNSGQPSAACINARAVIASGGALTAAQQQLVQTYSAQLTQDAINRGGVGLNQVSAQVASYTQSLIQGNLNAANAIIIQYC